MPTCNDTPITTHNHATATAMTYIGITTSSSTALFSSATLFTTVATNRLTSDCICITPITSPIVSINTVKIDSAFQQNSGDSNQPEISNFIQRLSKIKVQFGTPISYETIEDNDEQCFLLTGLKKDVLQCLIIYLKNYHSEKYRTGTPSEDQIILTLVRLRHDMIFEVLAYLRDIGKTTAIEYCWHWIDIMYATLKQLIQMVDRDHIFHTIPTVFKSKFPRLTSIINCFKIFIESPRNLLARAQCFSQCKRHCTIKEFISCTPLGAINFLPKCWEGCASDIQIVRDLEFTTLKYHWPGDKILADWGFTLSEDFTLNSGTELLIPAFTCGKRHFSAAEVERTRKTASVHIHIERVISLLKNRYTILKGTLPLQTVKGIADEANSKPFSSCDKIVTVCAALKNLEESIV